MSYFTSQEVGNPMQIIKNVELSKFQAILQNSVTFVESLFIQKPFKAVFCDFYKFRLVTKWGRHSDFKLLIMLQMSIMLFELC